MMKGQFDIGFGSISGNTYDPLNFLEVLKSDNSSGFTLNWGTDTNEVTDKLIYDNKFWSFDALWTAADQGAYVQDGANAPLDFAPDCGVTADGFDDIAVEINGDDVKITLDVREMNVSDGKITTEFYAAVMYGYYALKDGSLSSDYYVEVVCKDVARVDGAKEGYQRVVITFSKAELEAAGLLNDIAALAAGYGYGGFDLYYVITFFGVAGSPAYKWSVVPGYIPGYVAPAGGEGGGN